MSDERPFQGGGRAGEDDRTGGVDREGEAGPRCAISELAKEPEFRFILSSLVMNSLELFRLALCFAKRGEARSGAVCVSEGTSQ